jgi:hypothetical protein
MARHPILLCFIAARRAEAQANAGGGGSVSQSPLKDKAFSTFLEQNPPFELRPENGISPSAKACVPNGVIDNSAIERLAKGKLPSHRSA